MSNLVRTSREEFPWAHPWVQMVLDSCDSVVHVLCPYHGDNAAGHRTRRADRELWNPDPHTCGRVRVRHLYVGEGYQRVEAEAGAESIVR